MDPRKAAIGAGLSVMLAAACLEVPRAVAHPLPLAEGLGPASSQVADSPVVSADGLLEAPRTVQVPWFGAAGPDGAAVRVGQQVVAGQVLMRTDDRAAHEQLEQAQAAQRTAQQQLAAAQDGPSDEQVRLDRAQITEASLNYRKAQLELFDAEQRARFDAHDEPRLVAIAGQKLEANKHDLSLSRTIGVGGNQTTNRSLSRPTTSTTKTKVGTTTTTVTNTTATGPINSSNDAAYRYRQAQITAHTERSGVAGSVYDLAQAEHTMGSTLLDDVQRIRSLRAQARLARHDVKIAKLQADYNERNALAVAKQAIARADAQTRSAEAALNSTAVLAPTDGVVVGIVNQPDSSTVQGSGAAAVLDIGLNDGSKTRPSGFVLLADTSRNVRVPLDEQALDTIRPGQAARVNLAGSRVDLAGTVAAIAPAAFGRTGTAEVRIDLGLAGRSAEIGRHASVRILPGNSEPRTTVPAGVVAPVGNRGVVTVRRGSDLIKIPVNAVPTDNGMSQIDTSLLRPGDVVVADQ